ncbi:hypothetical protein E1301_Tti008811 [Triplophysa tibetana]|uniref:Uncharacterized protein n=1 Tax=Triplophysa tibetana TaxID=1572043 RepID=A0A5A9NZN3_9TELE|nr:hypothetical protein E1301_Tti008811 [Triplophysa tibetana]
MEIPTEKQDMNDERSDYSSAAIENESQRTPVELIHLRITLCANLTSPRVQREGEKLRAREGRKCEESQESEEGNCTVRAAADKIGLLRSSSVLLSLPRFLRLHHIPYEVFTHTLNFTADLILSSSPSVHSYLKSGFLRHLPPSPSLDKLDAGEEMRVGAWKTGFSAN